MGDFIDDLEKSMSGVGASTVWKRKFGDTVMWLSPITFRGQEAITELLGQADKVGINIINETKRMTLSHTIVGIGDTDLTAYRDGDPIFPSVGRDGRPAKVQLDRYIHHKIMKWSSQLVDDIFNVLGDLMETHSKENLAEIKFENAKDPEQELRELEDRVAELRESLGKPRLVEVSSSTSSSTKAPEEAPVDHPEAQAGPSVLEVPFDPFAAVAAKEGARDRQVPAPKQSAPASAPTMTVEDGPTDPFEVVVANASEREINIPGVGPVKAYTATPSVPGEVVEARGEQARIAPPIIDPVSDSRNPRFSQQR